MLSALREKIKTDIESADIAFLLLRIAIFWGGIGWLFFSEIPEQTFRHVSVIFAFFAVYCLFIYLWLFLLPQKKKVIYSFALFFDLLYASLLVRVTGGFESSFFNGFYLITALYSFYFGLIPGAVIAAVSSGLYFVSCGYQFYALHWTDFIVRVAFLFLLAVPLGVLSQKLKEDKEKMQSLNRGLEDSIEKLQQVQGKLINAEKLSALGRLTADVAHEIRNPLTSIGGFARRLNKKLQQGTKEKEYAEVIVTEVNRLERILKDVLTFSREPKTDMEYQDLNNIAKESMQEMEALCKEKSLNVVVMLGDHLPHIFIDRMQVKQAINNLVLFAIEAMPLNSTLTLKTSIEEMFDVDYVVVEVSDTGPGVKDEALKMIFEPFYNSGEIGVGTGLGLAICKKIMDEHYGLIFAESEPGKGTTVKMMFPYQGRERQDQINCWEFHDCGVENTEGAAGMRCPAYPNYGRICWAIAGTFCGQKVSGAIAQKLGDCRKCKFYQQVAIWKDI